MQQIALQEGLKQEKTLIVPIYEGENVPAAITRALGYECTEEIKREGGALTYISTLGKLPMQTLCFVGFGRPSAISYGMARQYLGRALRALQQDACLWSEATQPTLDAADLAKAFAYASVYSVHRFCKIGQKANQPIQAVIACDQDVLAAAKDGALCARCICHARDMGNMPSNYMTPEAMVEEARALAKELDLAIEVLDKEALQACGAGALLGVNRGSSRGAYLICLRYNGDADAPYTALVGKGLTFDSGGYSLKPRTTMAGMKYDMCGGATALCALELIVRRKTKANVMAIIATTENKVGSDGYTVDDVLVSLSGKTIEVSNTDAEGRLILCDALTYAVQQKAARIIDMATLTGACVMALGDRYTGVFTNSKPFLEQLEKAAAKAEEQIWQLPIDDDFRRQVHTSDVADLINAIAGAGGGSSLAAAFLEDFIPEGVQWIHLDIAGPAQTKKDSAYAQKGATGVMIETLADLF